METKTIKFSIGTCVRKHTVFLLHVKSPHTLFSAPLTGIVLTRVVHTSFPDHLMSHSTTRLFTSLTELRRTIASCPHIQQTCSIPWIFNFQSTHNVAPKPIDQSCSNSIFRVLLQLYPARPFRFPPTLKIKGSLHKKQGNKLSDKHDQLFLLLCY